VLGLHEILSGAAESSEAHRQANFTQRPHRRRVATGLHVATTASGSGQPRSWAAERNFACWRIPDDYRDYEELAQHHEGVIYVAMIRLILRRLAIINAKDQLLTSVYKQLL